ncbi:MAG TPA: hypothetical protein VMD91_06410 [Candidatus Sulfotelmatobacter sp.]|nr:hypothetical protein [Candidatus Sulfotelmatobacter sp.]
MLDKRIVCPIAMVAVGLIPLTGCGSSEPTDHTWLYAADSRDLGQDPPNWLVLAPGGWAYPNPLHDVIACDSEAAFQQYNESDDDATAGCRKTKPGSLLEIQRVDAQGKQKYILAVSTGGKNSALQYVGAQDLSPYIPADTELVVMDISHGSDDQRDTTPELVDQRENTIGTMQDHTRVRVRQVFPDSPTTYVAVTVLSGPLKGRDGYANLLDLNATTGDDDLTQFVGSSTDTATVTPTTSPTPTLMPTRTEIAQAVQRVIERGQPGTNKQGPPIFSSAFAHNDKMGLRILELFGAKSMQGRVDDVRGPVADVTTTYQLVSGSGARFHFTRHDTWTFAHGSGLWLLDAISVKGKTIDSIDLPGFPHMSTTGSQYDANSGKVTFTVQGTKYAWIPTKDLGWSIATISVPTAPPRFVPDRPSASAGDSGTAAASHSNPVHDTTGAGETVAAADPYSDCTSESIESVSDDGAVVKLLDGRKFLIQDADRYMTTLWLATDDVTVCDPGPGVSAKLIHEDDVVYGGHLQ